MSDAVTTTGRSFINSLNTTNEYKIGIRMKFILTYISSKTYVAQFLKLHINWFSVAQS